MSALCHLPVVVVLTTIVLVDCIHIDDSKLPSVRAARESIVVALSCYYINYFDFKSFSKTQYT